VATVESIKTPDRPSMPPVSLPVFGMPVFDVPVSHPECVDGWRREPLYVADLFRTQGLSVSNTGSAALAELAGPAQLQQDQSIKATNGMVGATRGRMTGGVPPRGRPD
jgi:hypothetical protein